MFKKKSRNHYKSLDILVAQQNDTKQKITSCWRFSSYIKRVQRGKVRKAESVVWVLCENVVWVLCERCVSVVIMLCECSGIVVWVCEIVWVMCEVCQCYWGVVWVYCVIVLCECFVWDFVWVLCDCCVSVLWVFCECFVSVVLELCEFCFCIIAHPTWRYFTNTMGEDATVMKMTRRQKTRRVVDAKFPVF